MRKRRLRYGLRRGTGRSHTGEFGFAAMRDGRLSVSVSRPWLSPDQISTLATSCIRSVPQPWSYRYTMYYLGMSCTCTLFDVHSPFTLTVDTTQRLSACRMSARPEGRLVSRLRLHSNRRRIKRMHRHHEHVDRRPRPTRSRHTAKTCTTTTMARHRLLINELSLARLSSCLL